MPHPYLASALRGHDPHVYPRVQYTTALAHSPRTHTHTHTRTSLHAHVPAGSRQCLVTSLGECMQCPLSITLLPPHRSCPLSITLLPPHRSMQCTPRVHDFFRDWKNAERAHLCVARLSRVSLWSALPLLIHMYHLCVCRARCFACDAVLRKPTSLIHRMHTCTNTNTNTHARTRTHARTHSRTASCGHRCGLRRVMLVEAMGVVEQPKPSAKLLCGLALMCQAGLGEPQWMGTAHCSSLATQTAFR
jgi:hypothetical protein